MSKLSEKSEEELLSLIRGIDILRSYGVTIVLDEIITAVAELYKEELWKRQRCNGIEPIN